MNDIRKRILTTIAVVFEAEVTNIPESAAPGSIKKWDSLQHMSLVVALENEFNIRFTDNEMTNLNSFSLIHEIISGKVTGHDI